MISRELAVRVASVAENDDDVPADAAADAGLVRITESSNRISTRQRMV